MNEINGYRTNEKYFRDKEDNLGIAFLEAIVLVCVALALIFGFKAVFN